MKHIKENSFKTRDLSLAATISLYAQAEAIDLADKERIEFIFTRDEWLDNLIESYWRQELKVEPQAYFQQIRQLKTRIHEARNYSK